MSKKKRRIERKRAELLARRKNAVKRACGTSDVQSEPLTHMRTRRHSVYVPEMLDESPISYAVGNETQPHVNQIIFKPHAAKELKRIIGWGTVTERNINEQQGILLGDVYKTPAGYVGVVEEVIASSAEGSAAYIESSHSEWYEMDIRREELSKARGVTYNKIGWWHTHPRMRVFMSETDRMTQRSYFERDWHFAVVLNPQSEKWAVFSGAEAESAVGCFMNTNVMKLKRG